MTGCSGLLQTANNRNIGHLLLQDNECFYRRQRMDKIFIIAITND